MNTEKRVVIDPVPGRVVWYHNDPRGGESGFSCYGERPFAAHIAYVWSPRMVNLLVVDHSGTAHSRTSVPLMQDGDIPPEVGHWCEWMPYQRGQAARTQQAEGDLAEVRRLAAAGEPLIDIHKERA